MDWITTLVPMPPRVKNTHSGRGNRYASHTRVLMVLADGRPRYTREVCEALPFISRGAIMQALLALEKGGRVIRLGDRKPHQFQIR